MSNLGLQLCPEFGAPEYGNRPTGLTRNWAG
ncbi:hypothetical protein IEO21_01937 [Rhodonia placenta]|uniref:Uncharacterized protein n=1 Tax=Rhodonia placenta TaxID=104341 RepID=A0A8H7P8Y9_9APHY|nr:hypothetical protein IEO21_01937 [Postia placenta]